MPGPATPPITYPSRSFSDAYDQWAPRQPGLVLNIKACHVNAHALRRHSSEAKASEKMLRCVAATHDVMSLPAVPLRRNVSIDQLENGGLETVDDGWLCVLAAVPSGESGKLIPDWAVYPSLERRIGYASSAPGRSGLPDELRLNPYVYVVAYGREPRR